MGVWIEIFYRLVYWPINPVTPCVGVWIEIDETKTHDIDEEVTPCVGVWIEMIPYEEIEKV